MKPGPKKEKGSQTRKSISVTSSLADLPEVDSKTREFPIQGKHSFKEGSRYVFVSKGNLAEKVERGERGKKRSSHVSFPNKDGADGVGLQAKGAHHKGPVNRSKQEGIYASRNKAGPGPHNTGLVLPVTHSEQTGSQKSSKELPKTPDDRSCSSFTVPLEGVSLQGPKKEIPGDSSHLWFSEKKEKDRGKLWKRIDRNPGLAPSAASTDFPEKMGREEADLGENEDSRCKKRYAGQVEETLSLLAEAV